MSPLQPQIQSLITLLGQAERERDERAAACREAANAQQTAQAHTEQLLTYRQEYEQRWSTQFRTDGRMELVNCYQGFMTRLTQAVEQQQFQAKQAMARFDIALVNLREAETRVAAVRRLIERRTDDARAALDRYEQKLSDEFASRAAWARNAERAEARIG